MLPNLDAVARAAKPGTALRLRLSSACRATKIAFIPSQDDELGALLEVLASSLGGQRRGELALRSAGEINMYSACEP